LVKNKEITKKLMSIEEEEKTSVQDAITQARKEATNLQQQIKKNRDLTNDTDCNYLLFKNQSKII
jgi:hypothetical protein